MAITRDEQGRIIAIGKWVKGYSGNPRGAQLHKHKHSKTGMKLARELIDRILADPENLDQLRNELVRELKEDPRLFVERYSPLFPKEVLLGGSPTAPPIRIVMTDEKGKSA